MARVACSQCSQPLTMQHHPEPVGTIWVGPDATRACASGDVHAPVPAPAPPSGPDPVRQLIRAWLAHAIALHRKEFDAQAALGMADRMLAEHEGEPIIAEALLTMLLKAVW